MKNTIVGVVIGVKLSFEALEGPAPTLVLSNFLMTDAVNLLSSLMGVKLTDLGVDLFLSAVLNPTGILLIGVTILSLLKEIAAVDLTGVAVNLEGLLFIGVAMLSLLIAEVVTMGLAGVVVNLVVPYAGFMLIGEAMFSFLKEIAAMDLTGVEVNLEVPLAFENFKEETGGFFLPSLAKTS